MSRNSEIHDTIENRDRIHVVMFFMSIFFFALAVLILVWTVKIQAGFNVDSRVVHLFRPSVQKHVEAPVRGRILATDGRPMAISAPLYDLYMDCTVRKEEFARKGDIEAEQQWRQKARELSRSLSAEFRDRSADDYAQAILGGRDRGSRYLLIKKNVDQTVLQKVLRFPLFCEGSYKGGLIQRRHDERIYPYDSLARRVIGYVKDANRIGLEANFDYELHGTEGYEWRRVTDRKSWIRDLDSSVVRAVDGNDIRTTLNVDFQDIADKALRKQINGDDDIRAGIVIIMEAATGAIRAMVNLSRGDTPQTTLWERENLALRQVGEQGSVMKTVSLLSLVEDGYVKSLEQTIPTNNGAYPNYKQDIHILDYQRETGRRDISVMHGFEISSNYVFTYLAETSYGSHPEDFFDHIYSYRLGEAFDFDISGLASPVVNRPGTKGWSKTTLGTTAYGYGMSVTPLHVATFYNGIANKGRMMKPYLVESVEKDGRVIKQYKPSVLNNICSRNTADTVTRALRSVVETGTATRLKGAKLHVAGKTGTAQVVLSKEERGQGNRDPYHDALGRKKNQGSFVGFFPAENPKYTILVSVYSYLSGKSFYGGTLPALAVRDIVDQLYALDGEWDSSISRSGSVPALRSGVPGTEVKAGKVPDVSGLGLKEALHLVESAGLPCSYEGCGHVTSQSPAAGSELKQGERVKLVLK
ncbi:MAG: transpeptidase family protein [Bacteroidales bacterium]|nr:transpeptidase family protein [Bacteroidales bacterium]